MYPASVTLPNQLGEAYLPLLLHLLDEFEQPSMICLVASNDICRAAQQVMTVLHTTHKCIELLATVA